MGVKIDMHGETIDFSMLPQKKGILARHVFKKAWNYSWKLPVRDDVYFRTEELSCLNLFKQIAALVSLCKYVSTCYVNEDNSFKLSVFFY